MSLYSFAVGLEVAIWLAGLVALWRVVSLGRAVAAPALDPKPITVEGFALGLALTVSGAWLLPYVVTHYPEGWLDFATQDGPRWEVAQAAAFQLGLLGGLLLTALCLRVFPSMGQPLPAVADAAVAPLSRPTRHPLLAGATAFLIAIPVINGIGLVWRTILITFGFPSNEQAMVSLFRDSDDLGRWFFMVILAAVLAPLAEELIFRAGLFRFLRTRLPRGLALALPALVFAVLHGNVLAIVPLFALGLFLALVYEQTGRISVPIIAHALFNFHTILLVMAGLDN